MSIEKITFTVKEHGKGDFVFTGTIKFPDDKVEAARVGVALLELEAAYNNGPKRIHIFTEGL